MEVKDLYSKIVHNVEDVEKILEGMNPGLTADRKEVISVIQRLVKDYIDPAGHLFCTNKYGEKYMDSEFVAGTETSGLISGYISHEIGSLDIDSEVIINGFAEAGIEIDPENREAFCLTWNAERAEFAISPLIWFLDSACPLFNNDNREIIELEKLLHSSLPDFRKSMIKRLIKSLSILRIKM